MKYDFTSIMDRRGKDAIAVEVTSFEAGKQHTPKDGYDIIPMWVADMNFPTLPDIQEAIINRTKEPHFGYFLPRDEYFDSIISWHEDRHGTIGLKREHIGYENSVLGCVVSALNVLCQKGDNVLLSSPTYIGFTGLLKNNGYNAIHSALVQDATGTWRMDFADMEAKIKKHRIHTMIFCSPHNPMGRCWEQSELIELIELCKKHDVYIVDDEIWSDLILTGHKHIPLQNINDEAKARTVAVYAPSKTFNMSGLVGAYHMIYNDRLRDRVIKEGSLSHYNMMNLLSMYGLIGAYSKNGRIWVDELCTVLTDNVDFSVNYIKENFPEISCQRPEATYMLFLDCTGLCRKKGISLDNLLDAGMDYGVIWQDGRPFFGDCHIRMNLALPTSRVKEAFERLNHVCK